ncbi:hypothetical protein LAU_0266 [Lausannevirus]|uniref:Uncharacterized protein n=3 Tax=Losannavirus TaxID=3152990 RepID=A0A0N7G2E9_9VIRU|nr:hypothetical protein LAU_0266 [Lausannevirus]YP_009506937.1 hypothetical protein D1R32_gp175 [Tunisvirus fontaine2]AEA07117.1 hypothetical protein LAU_0266 [Lausannevirus]AHC54892.1 hypothetical protein TNS_ORF174 [Tunisvirus fontaine2]ALH06936.1 hypothetical protein PMV_238 [Port-miou virus]
MTDCRLLTIVLIVAVVAIVFFVFGGCRVECDAKKGTAREGLDTLTDPEAYLYYGGPENPTNYKYGMTRKHVPLEMAGYGAYQGPTAFLGLPEDVGPQKCGPCQ